MRDSDIGRVPPATGGDEASSDRTPDVSARRNLVRWVVGILAVTVCLSIGSPLVGIRVFFPTDLLKTHPPWNANAQPGFRPVNPNLGPAVSSGMPTWADFRRGVLSGHFPLWTPYPSGGVPLGTLPYSGFLSILSLPYLILPLWYAPAAAKLLEMATAAGFTYLFLRRLGMGRVASLVGGLIYVNSGFQVVWTPFPQTQVGALIPVLFWAAEVAVARRSARGVVPLVIATALILLQGFPALAIFALVAAGLYVLTRIAASPGTNSARLKTLALVGGAFVLAAGIVSIQFLPFASQARGLDLSYRTETPGTHIPLRDMVTLGIPNAFGSPVDGNYFGQRHFVRTGYGPVTYHEIQSFIGATSLVLIVFAATRLGRRPRTGNRLPRGSWSYLWLGSALTAVLIYVGGPLLGILQTLPIFSLNYIGRLRAVFLFLLAGLAAAGFQALIDDRREERRSWILPLLVVGVGLAVGAFGLARAWQLAGEVRQRRYLLAHSALPILALGLTAAGVAFRKRVRLSGVPLVVWVAPLLIAAESLTFAYPYWPRTSKADFYPTTAAHQFLQRHLGGDRLAAEGLALYPGTTTFYGLRSVTAHTFEASTWADLVKAANGGVLSRIVFPKLQPKVEVATSPVLDQLSVRYFVAAPTHVFGQEVALASPTRTIALEARSAITEAVPDRRIRGVVVGVRTRYDGQDQHAVLAAQVLDASGAVLTEGSRPVAGAKTGRFVIALPEYAASGQGVGTVRVRISLRASGGRLILAADQQGRPTLSLVVPQEDGLKLVFTDGVLIYQRDSVLPRIRWASSATVVGDPAKQVELLAYGVSPDTVILNAAGPRASGLGATLRVPQGSGEQIRVDVDARGGGYLVFADAIQSGWRAWVDGTPSNLFPADHALGAVFVPAGRHEVRLQYDPEAWRLGELISGLSVLVLLALVSIGGGRRHVDAGR
ncbi:MAG: YfhO family protein [Actinobacteria bacterium]|nr:MAG: YfhO family protein [Actinomycetota bacterium]